MGYDSLVLGEQFELLGGGVRSTLPACAGAVFRLAPGFNLDAPHPTSSQVASLVLDGERPIGRRASNRTPTLPLVIQVPPTGNQQNDRATLAAARETLVKAVDAGTFSLRWTREGSTLPLVLDCYRAGATVVEYSILRDRALLSLLTVSFEAAPYGRSDTPLIVDFPTPLLGRAAPGGPVLIDDYSTVTGTHWSQSAQGPGNFSAFWTTGGTGVGVASVYTRSGLAPVNLTGMQGITVMAGFGSTGFFPWWALRWVAKPVVTFTFTLTDGTHSASVHVTRQVKASNNSVVPVWQRIRVPIPVGGGLNLGAITGYTLTVANNIDSGLRYTELYLSTLQGVPWAISQAVNPTSGAMIDLAGIAGSARAPISLQCSQPTSTSLVQTTKTYQVPGTFNWLAPFGATRVQRTEAYAAGGKGGAVTSSGTNQAGGGGGGEYQGEPGIPVTPGTAYTVVVGRGGHTSTGSGGNSSFTGDNGLGVVAHGGGNVADDTNAGDPGGNGATRIQQLNGVQGNFDGGIGTWVAGGGVGTVSPTSAQHQAGSGALADTSTAAGDMYAASCASGLILTQGIPCDPLFAVVVDGFSKAATTPRNVQLGAEFFNSAGTSLGQLFGATVANVTTGWTAIPTATLTPPAGSVWCKALSKVQAVAAAGETHWTDTMSLFSGVHRNGGNGGNGVNGSGPGGGGGSAGTTAGGGNGANGPTGTGGTAGGGLAGTGGGGGEASFVGVPNSGLLGGGGGGASTGFGALPGGLGGNGAVSLTYWQSPTFKTLIAHRPGFDAPDTLCPFVPVPVIDPPDGTHEYQVPTLIQGQPARFGSTYTVVAVNNSWNNPSASRQISVAVKHYEQLGGNVYTQTVARTLTPNQLLSPFVVLGELTLPDHAMPDDNTNAYFTITVTSGNTADRFQDVLFLDTQGSTVMIESPNGYVNYWIDEPAGAADIGNVMASMFDRPDAVSVLAYTTFSGPPLNVDPYGSQALMLYCCEGAPAAEMIHYPRWMLDRIA